MIPALKPCYVLLNRNFLIEKKTSKKRNYLPVVEFESYKNSRTKISSCKTLSSNVIEKNYSKPSDMRNTMGEDLDSEFSYNNSSEEDTKAQERQENKHNLSKTKEVKKNCSKLIEDLKNTKCADSDLESSYDSSSSEKDNKAQEKREKKYNLSKKNSKKLKCLLCNEFFSTYLSYLRHKRSHESKPFKCILCRKGYEHRQSFLNHMKKLHPEVDPFVCEYPGCEQNFVTGKRLEIHRKMHKKYMCKHCKKLFVRRHYMKKHVLKIH